MASVEPTPRLRLWKRVVLIGFSIGAGLVVVGVTIGLGIYWYYNHSRPTHKWLEQDLPQQGLKSSLSTKWRDGRLDYILTISPRTPDLAESFDTAFRTEASSLDLGILLYDSSGFKLCAISVDDSTLEHELDTKGQLASLTANSSAFNCSYGDYSDATGWNITWKNMPVVANSVPPPKGFIPLPAPSSGHLELPPAKHHTASSSKTVTEGTDTITGVDFLNSRIDTGSGRVFDVYLSGEKNTIITWTSNTAINFTCKGSADCTVVNKLTNETVHAHLEK